jgi:hypothetical protein
MPATAQQKSASGRGLDGLDQLTVGPIALKMAGREGFESNRLIAGTIPF